MPGPNDVSLVEIDVPFLDIVAVMVKWSLASIPAAIILSIVFFGLAVVVRVLFGAVFGA
jgi:hypothetical protein